MAFIESFDRKGSRIADLSRAEALMELVENPHKKLKFVHIAGTNGKGSMAQMFSEIFCCEGYRTGLFTSPYIIEYTDRIRLNGENIGKDELCKIVERIAPAIEASPLRNDFSQFEITQAVGMTYFLEKNCDVVVLETGLGGLCDCTNVIENPLVTVIGSISFDHTAILGDTIEKIAAQKAGIIKPHCPTVLSAGNPMEAVRVVREQAASKLSQLSIPNFMLLRVHESGIFGSTFSYKGEVYEISMPGLHQVSNAVTVIDAMKFVSEKLPVSVKSVKEGLKKAVLTGRTEVISKSPLTILDGGHNPDGTKALAEILKELPHPVTAVIGMHSDKNVSEATANLIPYVDLFITVDGFSYMDVEKGELAQIIRSRGGKAEVSEGGILPAIEKAQKLSAEGTAVICGSLYLVSYYHNHKNKD